MLVHFLFLAVRLAVCFTIRIGLAVRISFAVCGLCSGLSALFALRFAVRRRITALIRAAVRSALCGRLIAASGLGRHIACFRLALGDFRIGFGGNGDRSQYGRRRDRCDAQKG